MGWNIIFFYYSTQFPLSSVFPSAYKHMHKCRPNDYIRKERIKDRTKSHQLISFGINPRTMCVCVQPQNEVTIFLLLTDPIQTKGVVRYISPWQLQNLFAVGPSSQGLYNMVEKCNEHKQMCYVISGEWPVYFKIVWLLYNGILYKQNSRPSSVCTQNSPRYLMLPCQRNANKV